MLKIKGAYSTRLLFGIFCHCHCQLSTKRLHTAPIIMLRPVLTYLNRATAQQRCNHRITFIDCCSDDCGGMFELRAEY